MGRSSAPRVLCACEESQMVTERLRRMGIEAYSCDLLPTSGKHPEWHIQADALQVAKLAWDAVLAFPPMHEPRGERRTLVRREAARRTAADGHRLFPCLHRA